MVLGRLTPKEWRNSIFVRVFDTVCVFFFPCIRLGPYLLLKQIKSNRQFKAFRAEDWKNGGKYYAIFYNNYDGDDDNGDDDNGDDDNGDDDNGDDDNGGDDNSSDEDCNSNDDDEIALF